MKFDDIVNGLLNEMNSYVPTGTPSRAAQYQANFRSKEQNAGGDRAALQHVVYIPEDSKCLQWYKQNQPDSDIARQGWRSFRSRKAAYEFIEKWRLTGVEPKQVSG